MSHIQKTIALRALFLVIFSWLALSCKDYEYVNHGPGILEVHLAVKNTRTTIIPFSDFNMFNIVVKDFFVMKDDGSRLELFADLHAIRRNTNGDWLNCLSLAARDSALLWGITYAPVGTYVSPISSVTQAIVHDDSVRRFDGVSFSNIGVIDHYSVAQKLALEVTPPPFEVKEGVKTIVNLTLDLDQSFYRRSEVFEWFGPLVYVSSVEYQ